MSATLTWNYSGPATKGGTTVADAFADLVAEINSNSADANYNWQVASSNTGSTPYTVVLKRKDASAGRILLCSFTSSESNYNAAIFNGAVSLNRFYVAFFPAGNTDAVSNLNAASGTMMGDDTGASYVSHNGDASSYYTTNYQFFYFDCEEAMLFCWQNPAISTIYGCGAGYLLVDDADNVYPCSFGAGNTSLSNWGTTTGVLPWSSSDYAPNALNGRIRANYGGNNKLYYHAFSASGNWCSVASASSLMIDTGTSDVWFLPVQLLGTTRGEGLVLKWRQLAFGPPTQGAFATIQSTGPVTEAIQVCAATAGDVSAPWVTNFKI